MYAKVNIMENEETGKPLHEFYKSLVLGDLGEAVIDTMCTMGIMDGEYKSTLKGDTLDRVKGIDAFIGDTSIQVKLDARACETGNVALEVAEFKFMRWSIKATNTGCIDKPTARSTICCLCYAGYRRISLETKHVEVFVMVLANKVYL